MAAAMRRRRRLLLATLAATAAALGVAIQFAIGSSTWSIGSGNFPRPNDVEVEPVPEGPSQEVARGNNFGVDWVLYAYDSNRGLCLQLEYATPSGSSIGAGGCGFGVPSERLVGYSATRIDWGPGTIIAAPTALEVARVEVRLKGGATIDAATIEGPEELRQRHRFYVAALPGRAEAASIVGRDSRGTALDRVEAP